MRYDDGCYVDGTESICHAAYTWEIDNTPQDGMLLAGYEERVGTVKAIWIDSWHMQDQYMACEGTVGLLGRITLHGSYAAPPGPDWGWRIEIIPGQDEVFQLVMHNVTPEGEAYLAVEATYRRNLQEG